MISCTQARDWIHLYLDSELDAQRVTALESHLLDCEACRTEHMRWKEVADTVRGSKELYGVAPGSAERARKMIVAAEREQTWRYAAMAASLFIILATGGWAAGLFGGDGESFRVYAAESHSRHSQGLLPLDITSNDPAELSKWLDQQLPFHLEVPAYPNDGEKAYELVGARLLRHRDEDVAFLSYTMDNRPVSLMVASAEGRAPSGGSVYRSGELDFHFHPSDGLKLISWVDEGLSYVLVSDINAEGAQSCVVCHGQHEERQKFERLSPRAGIVP